MYSICAISPESENSDDQNDGNDPVDVSDKQEDNKTEDAIIRNNTNFLSSPCPNIRHVSR